MSRPTRQTAGGHAYLDLQNRARREGRTTQELLILYVLERWLARLAASPMAGIFVLKGGLLLAALDARRPTADADLLARHLANEEQLVAHRVQEIAQIQLSEDDGVEYLPGTLSTQAIREEDRYAAVRVGMDCLISTARSSSSSISTSVTQLPRRRNSCTFHHSASAILPYPFWATRLRRCWRRR